MTLVDSFGRGIDYLRISVTDRCNLRCVYCMPAAGIGLRPTAEMLTFDEIAQVVAEAVRLGVRRVRLTGGEPLVRRGLPNLIRQLAAISGLDEISLTTNGMLLERLAQPLAEAGLRRVNISLDTLDPDRFRRITRGGDITRVWRGIAAAASAGLQPIKINTVVIRGLNDDEIPSLAGLTLDHPWQVRFIELMPVGNEGDWARDLPADSDRFVPVAEMLARLTPLGLEADAWKGGNGPARYYRLPGATGRVGFISPLSEHFCASCNRLRLTADGNLRPCLLMNGEVPLRDDLRMGRDLVPHFHKAIREKPAGHELLPLSPAERLGRTMSQVGG